MSELRCRPGDLAVVIRDDYPQNIGAFVRVIGPNKGIHPRASAMDWITEMLTPIFDDGEFLRAGTTVCWKDGSLKPIRPPAPEKKTEVLDELVI